MLLLVLGPHVEVVRTTFAAWNAPTAAQTGVPIPEALEALPSEAWMPAVTRVHGEMRAKKEAYWGLRTTAMNSSSFSLPTEIEYCYRHAARSQAKTSAELMPGSRACTAQRRSSAADQER